MESQNRSVVAAASVFAGYTALMFVLERGMKSTGGPGIIPFELAGTEARATQIMDSWGERGRRAARTSLRLDFGYAASYGVLTALLLDRVRRRHDDSPLVCSLRVPRPSPTGSKASRCSRC
jgi:predicted hotdog family 3-hydroxylacyl-ACP dehydratase